MASEETVDIGSFSIASKADKNFVLTVSNSMTLSLPDHFLDHLTATELRDQVQAGALWLTRARSCRLTLAIHFERPAEVSVEEVAQWRTLVIDKFQSLQVWHDLGLELRPELNDLESDRAPSATSVYYIQHAQQHSGLFVPQGVSCGYISDLCCSFRYATTTSTASGKAWRSLPRPRTNTHYNLRKMVRTQTETRPVNMAAFWGLPLEEQAEKVADLTQNALNSMLGLRTRRTGFLYLEGTKQPGLLELAPAVWNAHYFQRVVSRAQLVPAISSALGNLGSTQSPALRRKIESLVPEAAADSGHEEVLDELQRRTEILLLRSARDQKIKTSPVPKALISNGFTDYASIDLVRETLHGQEDSHPQEAFSDFSDHDLMHAAFESSRGFADLGAGSAESNGIYHGFEDSCMDDDDMEGAEWIDDEMLSCSSESLPEYRGFYGEDFVGDETLDPTHGGREYQEQHGGPEAALQEHGTENVGFCYESDSYDYY